MKVEEVGNATGNAVRQFAGHAVFGNLGQKTAHPVVQFVSDVALHCRWECGETGAFGQFVRIFRKKHTQ